MNSKYTRFLLEILLIEDMCEVRLREKILHNLSPGIFIPSSITRIDYPDNFIVHVTCGKNILKTTSKLKHSYPLIPYVTIITFNVYKKYAKITV